MKCRNARCPFTAYVSHYVRNVIKGCASSYSYPTRTQLNSYLGIEFDIGTCLNFNVGFCQHNTWYFHAIWLVYIFIPM